MIVRSPDPTHLLQPMTFLLRGSYLIYVNRFDGFRLNVVLWWFHGGKTGTITGLDHTVRADQTSDQSHLQTGPAGAVCAV